MKVTLVNATTYVSMVTGKKYEKNMVYEVDDREGRTLLSARYLEKPFFRQIYEYDPENEAPTVSADVAPKAKTGVKVVRKPKGVSGSVAVNEDGEMDTANAVDV